MFTRRQAKLSKRQKKSTLSSKTGLPRVNDFQRQFDVCFTGREASPPQASVVHPPQESALPPPQEVPLVETRRSQREKEASLRLFTRSEGRVRISNLQHKNDDRWYYIYISLRQWGHLVL
ncbi:unnamed protein product [Chrysoparadoxa australica]